MSTEANHDRFEELLGQLVDGDLSRDEVAELVRLATSEPARVQEIQDQLTTAEMIALSEDELRDPALFASALETRIVDDPFVARVRSEVRQRVGWRAYRGVLPWGLAAATMIAAVAVWGLPWEATVQANVAELVDVQGAIRWTSDDGQVDSAPKAGQQLSSGTLDTLESDAWATLKFPDESSLTISGESSLSISAVKQKKQAVWNLRRGKLAGKVTVQPVGQPLLMYTPAAILQLPDSDFQVAADADRTTLAVLRGRARVERLSDKQAVDVPAAHRTVALVDGRDELLVEERGEPTAFWTANLQDEVSHGEWIDELGALRRRLGAAVETGRLTPADAKRRFADYASGLRLEGRNAGRVRAAPRRTDSDEDVRDMVSLTLSPSQSAPVVLTDTSRFRVRGRVQQSTDLVVGLGVGDLGTAPRARAVAAPVQVEGEFDVVLPLTGFRTRGGALVGLELFSWVAFTRGVDAELEITGVDLLGPVETGSDLQPDGPASDRFRISR